MATYNHDGEPVIDTDANGDENIKNVESVTTERVGIGGGPPVTKIGPDPPSSPSTDDIWLNTQSRVTSSWQGEYFGLTGGPNPLLFDAKHFSDSQYRLLTYGGGGPTGNGWLQKSADLETWTTVDEAVFETTVASQDGFKAGGHFYVVGNDASNSDCILMRGPSLSNLSLVGTMVTGESDAGCFYQDGLIHLWTEDQSGDGMSMVHYTAPISDPLNTTEVGVFDTSDFLDNAEHTGDLEILQYGGHYYATVDNATGPQPEYYVAVYESPDLYNWSPVVKRVVDKYGGDFTGVPAERDGANVVGFVEYAGSDQSGVGKVHLDIKPPGYYAYRSGSWTPVASGISVGQEYEAGVGGESITPWYVKEDWGDNALTDRADAIVGQYVSADDSVLRSRYRPEWKTASGSPSVSSGDLVLPAGNSTRQEIQTQSGITTGAWEFSYQFTSNPTTSKTLSVQCVYAASDERLQVQVRGDGNIWLLKNTASGSSVIVAHAGPDDTAEHTVRITRTKNLDGTFDYELFFDGVSRDTATDSFAPSPNRIRVRNEADAEVSVGWLEVSDLS